MNFVVALKRPLKVYYVRGCNVWLNKVEHNSQNVFSGV